MNLPAIEGTLPNLLSFCRTYESGSFTSAAKSLRVTPAAVSRAVARLEQTLGAQLFRRTTRALRPTAAGDAYYEKCSAALALLAQAEREIADGSAAESGVVRLSVGTTYGLHLLLPRLRGFRKRHPEITLEIEVSNLNADFVREGFDLAIRMGAIDDPGLVARKLGDFTLGVFAAPRYLTKHGTPRDPDDLAQHDTIAFVMPRTGRVLPWLFASPAREIVPDSRLRCMVDPMAALVLAAAGEGLAQGYHFMAARELASGALVEVLKPFAGRTRRFSLVYPRDSALSRAARVVVNEILALR